MTKIRQISLLALLAFVSPVSADSPPAAINLICIGQSAKDQEIGTVGSLLSGESHVSRVEVQDSVKFNINPDNSGSAFLPKRLQSTYKEANPDGSFRIVNVMRAQDEMSGKVRLHGMNKPTFRLDRLTGLVTISGSLGSFSGRCEPYDPAAMIRKF
jgi:hypothetical protein